MIKRIGVTIPLLFGIILLSIADVSAQSLGTAKSKSRFGATGSDRILENYLDVNSASRERRPEIFSDFSPEAKAGVFRFHLAFQLVKRPDLTGEQKEFILKTLSGMQSDAYDQSKADAVAKARQEAKLTEQGAMHLFSKKEILEIFASITTTQSEADLIRKYLNLSAIPSMDDRRDLFARSSFIDKSNYWQLHLAYSLAKYSELSFDQQKIVLDAIDLIKPEIYAIGKAHRDRQIKVEIPVSALSARVLTAFSRDIGSNIFIKLGGRGGPTVEQLAKCNCALGSIPSCWDEICQSYACLETTAGCGVFWVWSCDGRCPARPQA